MSWRDFESDSFTDVLDQHGELITYTPKGGSGVALTALFSEITGMAPDDEYSEREIRKAIVDLAVAQTITASGTITYASELWHITGPYGRDLVVQSWRVQRIEKVSSRQTKGRR
jgi:hypothetical protein